MFCSQKTKDGKQCFCKVMKAGNRDLCRVHFLQQERRIISKLLSPYKCYCIKVNGEPCTDDIIKGSERCHLHQKNLYHICWFKNHLGIQCDNLIDARQKYCEKHKPQELDID